jgi:hypothetical protein
MRRRLLLAVVGLVVAVSCTLPPAAAGQVPTEDSVVGDGEGNFFLFDVDARSGPSGENPSGTATWHLGRASGPTWTVDVTCLSVTGNTAVIGFSGTVSRPLITEPTAGLIRVVDAGGPNSGLDSFEFAEQRGDPSSGPLPGPTECSSFPSIFPFVNGPISITSGDIVVTDAQPFPTSKEQCKAGGWRNFPDFKNEGDCVSFVATGGRNPPAGP